MRAISTASAITRWRWKAPAKSPACDFPECLSRRSQPDGWRNGTHHPAELRSAGRCGRGAGTAVRAGRTRCGWQARDRGGCGAVRSSVAGRAAERDRPDAHRGGDCRSGTGRDQPAAEDRAAPDPAGQMKFGEKAAALSGLAARLLGWRPAEFWAATPAELAAALLDEA